tara:strand:+ start:284 stop:661 length:378 start_codon:yes stop_codon:yes gene_type:complete
MGNTVIYGRFKDNDRYTTIYDTLKGEQVSRFKHEVYAYALDKKHQEMKSIYLYKGYFRIVKAIVTTSSGTFLQVDFASMSDAEQWDTASIPMDITWTEIPWVERDFVKTWKPVRREQCRRVYQKL